MKLIQLLLLMDPVSTVVLYERGDDEAVFTGACMNVPWIYAERHLAKILNDNTDAMFVSRMSDDAERYPGQAILVIGIEEDVECDF